MSQLLLFADPRPLVDRLGARFFREAPEGPGVYLMKDDCDTVLYVGKAKNLRKRLASYRVANPERLRPRHLRLLRAAARIEFERCLNEAHALSRESQLLRHLRPRFNRAGTWPGPSRFLAWRETTSGLEFGVTEAVEPGWCFQGPLGIAAFHLRAALLRLLWCAFHPDTALATLPVGWFDLRRSPVITVPTRRISPAESKLAQENLALLSEGEPEMFIDWILQRTAAQAHPFEVASREADLEVIRESALKPNHLETAHHDD